MSAGDELHGNAAKDYAEAHLEQAGRSIAIRGM